MSSTTPMSPKSERTVVTLSNAITLVTEIVQEIAGTEVSDMLNGSVVSRDALHGMIASQINRNFSTYLNAGAK